MTTGELQKSLFDAIKEKVAQNASIAQEVSELLDISADSAYRRMRGEKPLHWMSFIFFVIIIKYPSTV